MSHDATNWAIQQRGLRPAAKIVLWHLCDRYNPDYGCYPSQERLAHDCEMSRSSLNNQLDALENAGLIVRERSNNQKTKKRQNTRYKLGFESDFPCPEFGHGNGPKAMSKKSQKPCPKNGESHVQNLDTNLVREPVREPVISQDALAREKEVDLVDGENKQPCGQDDRAIEKAFRRSFAKWPGYLTDSEDKARAEWWRLSDGQRLDAEAGIEPYLAQNKADGRSFVIAFATFLREKRWEKLSKTVVKTDPSKNYAAAFGTDWGIVRFCYLLEIAGAPPVYSPGQLGLYAGYKYPGVERMQAMARKSIGVKTPEKPAELRQLMEFISIDYDLWDVWQDEHMERGWPWLDDVGERRGAWFPKGGPEGLAAFERALRQYYQPVQSAQSDKRNAGPLERYKKGAVA